jgi:hypothetical protein
MSIRDVRDMMMSPPPPADPGPLARFIEAYEEMSKGLTAAQQVANKRRNELWYAMINAVSAKHRLPHLGSQRLETERARARQEFAVDKDKNKLDAALKAAEEQKDRDVKAEYADRDAAIAEWKRIYGPSQQVERETFDRACETLYEAFKASLEAAIVVARSSSQTIVVDYKASVVKADVLMPPEETTPGDAV